MQPVHTSAPSLAVSANRWRRIGRNLTVATSALFAMSLASANGAPLHSNNHHHHYPRGGYAAPSNPLESLPTGAWTHNARKPVEIFGQKVDP